MNDAQSVRSREDLVTFLESLSARVRRDEAPFENVSAADLLQGAAGWVTDMNAFFTNQGRPVPAEPDWTLVAMIFAAGLVYE
jgi:hypothetical protein